MSAENIEKITYGIYGAIDGFKKDPDLAPDAKAALDVVEGLVGLLEIHLKAQARIADALEKIAQRPVQIPNGANPLDGGPR